MRKLATIRQIATVDPVANSDNLDCVTMVGLGWRVVAKRGSLKPGDRVVYFEIDSALPVRSGFEFLRKSSYKAFRNNDGSIAEECYRLRTVRLRGTLSQGLVLPLGELLEDTGQPDGQDVGGELGVQHYDELREKMQPATKIGSDSLGLFPTFVPKTDEERIQNLVRFFDENKKVPYEVTEKADGSSMTVIYSPTHFPDDPFQICSRNLRIKRCPDSRWMAPLIERDTERLMEAYYRHTGQELAVQGELVGPGVNGNRDNYREYKFLVFRIWDILKGEFLGPDARTLKCVLLGLDHVKVLRRNWRAFKELTTIEAMLEFAEGKTDNGFEREGVVFKADDHSFKCISNKYLLGEKR